ncbi:Fibroblast growth factor 1 [Frankliniella fusca]|uniref:Fibroblast growth factor n=1 Tax=Frankliniella fusca TaxID=407009 RepID=A0AAE1HR12_9NEOP|nr:Fibroblast growth factor 1 [Frankliniella fusca]
MDHMDATDTDRPRRHDDERRGEEDGEEDDDDEEEEEEGEDDYDFDGGGGDAVDDAPNGPVRDGLSGLEPGGPGRVKRSCWPPPPPRPAQPRGPVWAPLLRVQPPPPPPPPPPRYASQAGPSGPSRSQHAAQRPGLGPGPGPVPVPRARPGPPGLRPGPGLTIGRPAGLNPVYGNRMKLYCRTGYHLSIGPKGRVTGTTNPTDKYAVLEFSSVTNGEVRIRGVEANLFLAMNRQGKLYGQANVRQEGTVFVEMMLGQYNTYLSRKFAHIGWYVGIKKNGKQKPGQKTAWGQKAIQFLPIRV